MSVLASLHPHEKLKYPPKLQSLYSDIALHARGQLNETLKTAVHSQAHTKRLTERINNKTKSPNLLSPMTELLKNLNNPFDLHPPVLRIKDKTTVLVFKNLSPQEQKEFLQLLLGITKVDIEAKLQGLSHQKLSKYLQAIKPIIYKGQSGVQIIANYLSYMGESNGRLSIAPVQAQEELANWAYFINEAEHKYTDQILEKWILEDSLFAGQKIYTVDEIIMIKKTQPETIDFVDLMPIPDKRAEEVLRSELNHSMKDTKDPLWDLDMFEWHKRLDEVIAGLTHYPKCTLLQIAPSQQKLPLKEASTLLVK